MNRFLFIILPVFVVSFVLLSCSEENMVHPTFRVIVVN